VKPLSIDESPVEIRQKSPRKFSGLSQNPCAK
jgi:hypothetical protein